MKLKKIVIAIALAAPLIAFGKQANAGLSDMQRFFDDVGVMGNVSMPNSFQGQTRDFYTGGGVQIRAPQRTYQLATFDPPRMPAAGCSGIDIYAGAFSFINSDQLVQMLQNIGNNAVGAAFALALKSVSPQLEAVVTYFQDLAQKVNAMNLNSCQVATGIVTATAEGSLASSARNQIEQLGTEVVGLFPDFNSARVSSGERGGFNSTLNQIKGTSALTEEQKFWLEPGNLLFRALDRLTPAGAPGFTDEEKLMIQSMFGSIIITHEPDADGELALKAHQLEQLETNPLKLLMGEETGRTAVRVYQCNLPDCNDARYALRELQVETFNSIINQRFQRLHNAVMSRSVDNLQPSDFYIVNISTLPLWTMIENSYRTGAAGSTVMETTLVESQRLIAMAFSQALLHQIIFELNLSLNAFNAARADSHIKDQVEQLRARIRETRVAIDEEYAREYQRFQIVLAASDSIANNAQRVRTMASMQLRHQTLR
jgi:conjugative transfer pilus assembly protein TraH